MTACVAYRANAPERASARPLTSTGTAPRAVSWRRRALLGALLVLLPVVAGAEARSWRPYRVLVVTGTQVLDAHTIVGALDTGDVIGLLQLWGVPFDVLRLADHGLAASDLVDADGRPTYGTILWTARQDQYPWQAQDYQVLVQACVRDHVSLIALGPAIRDPAIDGLLGLSYEGWGPMTDAVVVDAAAHFVTRSLSGETVPTSEAFPVGYGPLVSVTAADTTTLANAGARPELTVRTVDAPSRTRAVWIGGDSNTVYSTSATFITLLRRALVWAEGYALYKEYGRSVVLRMDDVGAAPSAYLPGWHYGQLGDAAIATSILAPLRAHHARASVGFVPGFPWIPTRSVRPSCSLRFVDPYGTLQNLRSTCVGIRAGARADLLDVESHGFTHMVPDLATPALGGGAWWDGSPTREWSRVDWYREFRDVPHDTDIDAATQATLLAASARAVNDVAQRPPLTFIPPGHLVSGEQFMTDDGPGNVVTLDLVGAQPNRTYAVWFGKWGFGSLATDGSGDGTLQAPLTSQLRRQAGNYFAVFDSDGAQFIAGPTVDPLYTFALPLRDAAHMTPAEHARFSTASETLHEGTIVGDLRFAPARIASNYTYAIAATAGFGLASDATAHYLDPERTVTLGACRTNAIADSLAHGTPAVVFFHDRDVARDPTYLTRLLDDIETTWPGAAFLGFDEWAAYLHTALHVSGGPDDAIVLEFVHPSGEGGFFTRHRSSWTLHLSDELRDELAALGTVEITTDGTEVRRVDAASFFGETVPITVPPSPSASKTHTVILRHTA
jgi:hypothetical protein